MNFEKALRLSLYCTLVAGALLISVAQRTAVHAIMVGVACLLHHVAVSRLGSFALSRKAAALLAVLAVVYTVYDVFNTEYILFSAANFLIMLQIIKLFQKKIPRDYKEMFLMSLVLVGVSAVMTVDAVFAPAFVLYVASAVWSLLLFTIKQDCEAGSVQPVLSRRTMAAGTKLFVCCIGGAAVMFLLFPRIGPSFSQLITPTRTLAGFSERVHLREAGMIEPNPQVAFRAAISGPRASSLSEDQLLWRGLALDNFNGTTWSNSTPRKGQYSSVRLPFSGQEEDPSRSITQKIDMMPSGAGVFFAIGQITGMNIIKPHHMPVRLDRMHETWTTPLPGPGTISYQARSQPGPDHSELAQDRTPVPPSMYACTHLPKTPERMIRLAFEIAPEATCPTILSKVEAVQRYLEQNYTYIPELPGEVDDPVDHFLFVKKRGHCEIFASAMAVLLRCRGVAARIVNGYYGGQWNEFLNVYIVRQTNAHSWVEVYFPGKRQWVQFNPSPLDASVTGYHQGWLAYLRRMRDFMNVKWTDNVIYYGQQHQTNLARRVTAMLINAIAWLGSSRGGAGFGLIAALKWLLRAGICAAMLWLGWHAALALAGLRRRKTRTKASLGRTKFYRELLALLAKRGHRRHPSQTPLEFARAVVACEGPNWDDVNAITRMFCDVRYGNAAVLAVEDEIGPRLNRLRRLGRGGLRAAKSSRLHESPAQPRDR